MDKTARLQLLKDIGQRHAERENLLFTGIPLSDDDIQEEVHTMDTFMEHHRDRQSTVNGLNSDER